MSIALTALRTALNKELKIDPNNKIWSLEEKDQAINDAYEQIQNDGDYNWRENQANVSVTTTGGTQEYDLPADFIRLEALIIDNYPMRPKDYIDVKRLENTSNSKPNEYYLRAGKYGFYPTPDASYSLDFIYRKKLPTITSSVDAAFPASFMRAIAKYSAFIILSTPRGNEGVASVKLNDYEREINKLRLGYQLEDMSNLSWGFMRRNRRNYDSPKALW